MTTVFEHTVLFEEMKVVMNLNHSDHVQVDERVNVETFDIQKSQIDRMPKLCHVRPCQIEHGERVVNHTMTFRELQRQFNIGFLKPHTSAPRVCDRFRHVRVEILVVAPNSVILDIVVYSRRLSSIWNVLTFMRQIVARIF